MESEGFEEKFRAVIKGAIPTMRGEKGTSVLLCELFNVDYRHGKNNLDSAKSSRLESLASAFVRESSTVSQHQNQS